ncbi:sugar transferase [Oceanibium sediminis]|uniref:sugar transferase n=1 Tax=Oceanibium sediminis TaxID=2026339 RepID=UPI000DD3A15E|nr:sugar transferase [Oceanibium sediminis]
MYSDQSIVLPVSYRAGARAYEGFFKRFLDIVAVLAAAPLVAPLVVVLALVLRAQGQAAFYSHARVGRGGVVFRCWKLQTMVADAERSLARHLARNPAAAREWLRHRKLRHDPRVTRFGRFLRKTSLDELPQLYNVLRGDMSLVGPRPITAQELRAYGSNARAYLAVTPGITGLWQIRGRNRLAMDQRIACDVEYARDLSLWRDGWILLRTVPAVLSGGH